MSVQFLEKYLLNRQETLSSASHCQRDYKDGGFLFTALEDPYLVQNQEINGLRFVRFL